MSTAIQRPTNDELVFAHQVVKRAEKYYNQLLEQAGIQGYARIWPGGLDNIHVTLHTHGLRLFGERGRKNSTWKTFPYGSAEAIQGINDAAVVQAQKTGKKK